MIPSNRVTNTPVVRDYLYPKPDTKLVDRALGGIALQNTSEGYEYQVWEIYYENGKIKSETDFKEVLNGGIFNRKE